MDLRCMLQINMLDTVDEMKKKEHGEIKACRVEKEFSCYTAPMDFHLNQAGDMQENIMELMHQ
jgi:hypothetical protein